MFRAFLENGVFWLTTITCGVADLLLRYQKKYLGETPLDPFMSVNVRLSIQYWNEMLLILIGFVSKMCTPYCFTPYGYGYSFCLNQYGNLFLFFEQISGQCQ